MSINDLACTTLVYNERLGRDVPVRAAVYCTAAGCATCAFNPGEKYRRLATGKWVRNGKVWTLHFKPKH